MKKKLTKIEKQLSDNFQTKQKKEHNSENLIRVLLSRTVIPILEFLT